MRNIGYVERDRKSNEELRKMVARQPISIGMRISPRLNSYDRGIATEEFLRCSSKENEVNHGVLLVGYGTVSSEEIKGGSCKEYWVIRNSWGERWGESGFFKLCADGVGSSSTPFGACLVNKFAVYPTMDVNDIEADK